MQTRKLVHEEQFDAPGDRLFALLHTASAIRRWWSADRAIVVPETGGVWAAAWGESEDQPEYVTVATISAFDPPRRLELSDYSYWAKSGPLPFEADFRTEFQVEAGQEQSLLRVIQSGFPRTPEGDEFYDACRRGWSVTFDSIRRFLHEATDN